MNNTARYDNQGRFLGHSIEVPHHTTGKRAWCLEGLPEWCYPDAPCDSCQRAQQGDPWETIDQLTAENEKLHYTLQKIKNCLNEPSPATPPGLDTGSYRAGGFDATKAIRRIISDLNI